MVPEKMLLMQPLTSSQDSKDSVALSVKRVFFIIKEIK
jgi:hypothetical protein